MLTTEDLVIEHFIKQFAEGRTAEEYWELTMSELDKAAHINLEVQLFYMRFAHAYLLKWEEALREKQKAKKEVSTRTRKVRTLGGFSWPRRR